MYFKNQALMEESRSVKYISFCRFTEETHKLEQEKSNIIK